MQDDPRSPVSYPHTGRPTGGNPSLWQKLVGGVVMIGVFALALAFSVALFAVIVVVGAALWGYLWWKTRELRKAMREHVDAQMAGQTKSPGEAPGRHRGQGVVIDGEVIRDDEPRQSVASQESIRTKTRPAGARGP